MQSKLSQGTASTGIGRGSAFFLLAADEGLGGREAMACSATPPDAVNIDLRGDDDDDFFFVPFSLLPVQMQLKMSSTGVEALCSCSSNKEALRWTRSCAQLLANSSTCCLRGVSGRFDLVLPRESFLFLCVQQSNMLSSKYTVAVEELS